VQHHRCRTSVPDNGTNRLHPSSDGSEPHNTRTHMTTTTGVSDVSFRQCGTAHTSASTAAHAVLPDVRTHSAFGRTVCKVTTQAPTSHDKELSAQGLTQVTCVAAVLARSYQNVLTSHNSSCMTYRMSRCQMSCEKPCKQQSMVRSRFGVPPRKQIKLSPRRWCAAAVAFVGLDHWHVWGAGIEIASGMVWSHEHVQR
jgi:hypothetical protein